MIVVRHAVLRNPAGTNWPSGRKQAESTRGNTTKMYAVSGTRLNVCSDDSNFFVKSIMLHYRNDIMFMAFIQFDLIITLLN